MKTLLISFAVFMFLFLETLAQTTIGVKLTGISAPVYNTSGVPERVRAVPRHTDDIYLTGVEFANNALPDNILNVRPGQTLFTSVYMSFADILGLGFSFISPLKLSSDRFSQNQYGNSDNGYGTSLRYYKAINSGVGCGLYASIGVPTIKISDFGNGSFGFRPIIDGVYQLASSSMRMESGWDRYGGETAWQTWTVGKISQHYLNGGLEFNIKDEDEFITASLFVGYTKTFITYDSEVKFDGQTERGTFVIGGSISFAIKGNDE